MGFLWVDTSVNPVYVGAPYFPPQTPPVSGTNFFTDTSGQIWASRNGSAWVRANQMCRARMYLNSGSQSMINGYNNLVYDTIEYDPLACCTAATGAFVVPLDGDYLVTGGWVTIDAPISTASATSTINCNIIKNGTTYVSGEQTAVAGYAQNGTAARISSVVSAVAGDVLHVRGYTNVACTTYSGGLSFQSATFHRMN